MDSTIGVGTFTVTPRMRELVDTVLNTGRISYGPMSRILETQFANIHDCKHAVLSNSGTSSLQVALQAMKEIHGWQDGDEVIVPACTFVATVNIVLHNRMTPVLVDVESDYYGINPSKIPRAITERTRAIIPVHLFGMPCNMTAVHMMARQRGLKIIEDSCETMFVDHGRRRVGSWGDVGCFSLYVAHLLTAGVGGIATTNDADLSVKMRSLVNHGRDGIYLSIDDDDGLTEAGLREVVERRFNFVSIGHSYRVTELEAALALGQLTDWPLMIAKRQENARYLSELLEEVERQGYIQRPLTRLDTGTAHMMYPIVAHGLGEDKWGLCNYLEAQGIETREMLRLTDQPAYEGMWDPVDYPVAGWLNKYGFYVGCHQDLGKHEMERIAEAITRYCKRGKPVNG